MSPSTSLRPPQPGGFISRRHRSVQKDRPLLKKLEALAADGKLDGACIPSECAHEADAKGNEALRAHFQQLTEKMLVPLNRYFQTLVPTLSPAPSPNPSEVTQSSGIKPFSLPAFLTHLRTHDPNPLSFRTKGLSTKARVEHDFYAAFGISATFAGWLAARVESLGLAVAAQTSNLAVPNNGAIQKSAYSSVGLGLESFLRDGQRSAAPSLSDASESDATRMSSEDDSSLSSWRANEESWRENDTPIGEDCYRRRASEGAVNLFAGAQRRTDRSG